MQERLIKAVGKLTSSVRVYQLPKERLRELFVYRNGALYWRNERRGCKRGSMAGRNGVTSIDSCIYRTRVLVWNYHHGIFPDDHKLVYSSGSCKIEDIKCVPRTSHGAIARDLGVSESSLSRWLSGTREPSLEKKIAINNYFRKVIYKLDKKTQRHLNFVGNIRGLLDE